VINDLFQRIQAFLDGENEAVMYCTDVVGCFLRRRQVR